MSLKDRTGLSWSEPSLCYRYEDEINKRTALENEFVLLKKVCGGAKPGEVAGGGCEGSRWICRELESGLSFLLALYLSSGCRCCIYGQNGPARQSGHPDPGD